jgi:hypothetical protein
MIRARSVHGVREHSNHVRNAAIEQKIRLVGCYVLDESEHIAGITVLIVVPRD